MRVLVVGRAYDLSAARYDGFVLRHRLMLEVLDQVHELIVQPLDTDERWEGFHPELPGRRLPTIAVPPARADKRQRLSKLLRPVGRPLPWEIALERAAMESAATVALTLGPWLDEEYAVVYRNIPTVHVFEEDVTRMVEIAPQTCRARMFRRLERLARRRRVSRPAHVIVIAEAERGPASRQFGRRTGLTVIPQTLVPSTWPPAQTPSHGEYLFCVGALNQTRQSEGLVAFLEALRTTEAVHIPILLLSGGGLHPDLAQLVTEMPQVSVARPEDDVYELYRRARMALVPSQRATGMKATILQAWTTGCPVAAYSASAKTVGHLDALIAADGASRLVKSVLEVWVDKTRLEDLAHRGMRAATHFDHARWFDIFRTLVEDVAGQPANERRRRGTVR